MYDIISVSRGRRKDRVEGKITIVYQLTLVIGSYDATQLKAKFQGNAEENHTMGNLAFPFLVGHLLRQQRKMVA